MNVAVVGGGYAGMAAAVTLAERRVRVTVFEAAAHLGGRARRVSYRGAALDNGLHILIGAYRETLRLMRLVSADSDRALLRLPFDWRIHGHFRLRALPLPAPLHLALGLLAARGVGFGARLASVRFIRNMRAQGFRLPQDMSVAHLLEAHRQNTDIVRFLWRPLCVAALNTPPEEASARIFLNVLRASLDADRADSDLLLARRDLTSLFPEPAARFASERGSRILVGHTVTAITADDGRFHIHARGQRFESTHVICALPPHRLLSVIAGLPQLSNVAALVERVQYQPIYSVYLQYPDRVRLPAAMLGLAEGPAHWIFDREAICGQRGLVAAVTSAAGPHQELHQNEFAQRAHAEIARRFGPLPAPLWQRVIAEKRATFACKVGVERPAQRTPLRNFYLAGDYTASDYPATIEAAAQSGTYCAREIIASM